jgi:hypothetical protein
MSEAARRSAAGDAKSAFAALERSHVLGQFDFVPHLRVHWQMLRIGWVLGDRREVTGQLMVSVGAGRASVSDCRLATQACELQCVQADGHPPDLERLIEARSDDATTPGPSGLGSTRGGYGFARLLMSGRQIGGRDGPPSAPLHYFGRG